MQLPGDRTVKLWSSADDWITSRVWWRGLAGYESETVLPLLRFAETARVVLDVGAFTGYYSLLAAAMNPDARVFAFEAHSFLAARIGKNVSLNPGLQVTVMPYAVCEARGPVDFHYGFHLGPGLPSSSSIGDDWAGRDQTRRVAGLDIDSFCDEWAVRDVDLVKIDVESREPEVIAGMRRTIERDRPVIVLEVLDSHRARYGETEKWLAEHGYRFFALAADGPSLTQSLVARSGGAENYLACPEEKVPPWLAASAGGDRSAWKTATGGRSLDQQTDA